MYIISQDSYFVLGMDNLLKSINPYATHTLIAFDRGDGKNCILQCGGFIIYSGR